MNTVVRVVRRQGSDRTHLVQVLPTQLVEVLLRGQPATAIATPVVAVCRAVLHSPAGVVVCMKAGTPVRCQPCRTSGVAAT